MQLQQLLPNCCRQSRLQSYHHTRPDMPTIPCIWCCWHRRRDQFWQVQRENASHHCVHGYRLDRFHYLLCNTQRASSIHQLLPVCFRSIFLQFHHSWMVQLHARFQLGEEGGISVNCQRCSQCELYLYGLSLPGIRWTEVLDCYGKQCCFCIHDYCLGLVPEGVVAKDE